MASFKWGKKVIECLSDSRDAVRALGLAAASRVVLNFVIMLEMSVVEIWSVHLGEDGASYRIPSVHRVGGGNREQ